MEQIGVQAVWDNSNLIAGFEAYRRTLQQAAQETQQIAGGLSVDAGLSSDPAQIQQASQALSDGVRLMGEYADKAKELERQIVRLTLRMEEQGERATILSERYQRVAAASGTDSEQARVAYLAYTRLLNTYAETGDRIEKLRAKLEGLGDAQAAAAQKAAEAEARRQAAAVRSAEAEARRQAAAERAAEAEARRAAQATAQAAEEQRRAAALLEYTRRMYLAGLAEDERTKNITQLIRVTRADAEAMSESNARAAELGRTMGQLANRLAEQRQRLELLRERYAQLAAAHGEGSAQARNQALAISRLTNTIAQGEERVEGYARDVKKLANEQDNAGVKANKTNTIFRTFFASLAGAASGVALVELLRRAGQALIDIGGQALEAVGYFERLGFTMQTLVAREIQASGQTEDFSEALRRAAQPAQELIGWVRELAIASPFSQRDVAEALRLAQAYSFTTEEAKRLTQATVNFAAGTGLSGEFIERISVALGQVQTKGKLAGEEIRQLTEAGIPVVEILAGAFNKSTKEIVEMQERGLIPANDAIEAIVGTLERDFQGAAERQVDTWVGLISTIGDIKEIGLQTFFQSFFDAIQPLANRFVDTLGSDEFLGRLDELGAQVGNFAEGAVDAFEALDFARLAENAKLVLLYLNGIGNTIDDLKDKLPLSLFTPDEEQQRSIDQLRAMQAGAEAAAQAFEAQGRTAEAANVRLYSSFILVPGVAEELLQLVNSNTQAQQAYQRQISSTGVALGVLEKRIDRVNQAAEEHDVAMLNAARAQQAYADSVYQTQVALSGTERAIQGALRGGWIDDFNIAFAPDPELADKWKEQGEFISQVNDATERYTESNEALAERSAAATEAWRDAEVDAAQDRAEAQNQYIEGRAEAYADMIGDIRDSEKDLNESLQELAKERAEAEIEAQEGRVDAQQELTDRLAEIEESRNEQIADAIRQRNEKIEDIERKRVDAHDDMLRRIEDLERKTAQKIEDLQRSLDREIEDFERDRAERADDLARDIAEIERKRNEKLLDIAEKYNDAVDDFNDKRVKRAKDTADRIYDIEKRAQERRDDLLERAEDIIFDENAAEYQNYLNRVDHYLRQFDGDIEKAREAALREASKYLGRDEQRDLEKILREREKVTEEAGDSISEVQRKAQEAQEEERKRHEEAVEDIRERYRKEVIEAERAIEERQRKYDEEEAEQRRRHDRAVEDYNRRIQRETEELRRQTDEIKRQYQERVDEFERTQNEAERKLGETVAEQNRKYAEAQAAAEERYAAEIEKIDETYADAIAKINDKTAKEIAKHEERKQAVIQKYNEEAAALEESYNKRLRTIDEKLTDAARKHAEAQLDIQEAMQDNEEAYIEALSRIRASWDEAAEGPARFRRELWQLTSDAAQLSDYLRQHLLHAIPEMWRPGSPSPLELSLQRTEGLLQGLASTVGAMPSLPEFNLGDLADIDPADVVERLRVGLAHLQNTILGDVERSDLGGDERTDIARALEDFVRLAEDQFKRAAVTDQDFEGAFAEVLQIASRNDDIKDILERYAGDINDVLSRVFGAGGDGIKDGVSRPLEDHTKEIEDIFRRYFGSDGASMPAPDWLLPPHLPGPARVPASGAAVLPAFRALYNNVQQSGDSYQYNVYGGTRQGIAELRTFAHRTRLRTMLRRGSSY